MIQKPIDRIRELVKGTTDSFLDECPQEWRGVVIEIFDILVFGNDGQLGNLDVPVRNICLFCHLNFAHPNTSWRNLIYPVVLNGESKEGVTGDQWSNEVFKYFESDLLNKEFPAGAAKNQLCLHLYGNIACVMGGTHRTVGGVNYLVSKFGSDVACFKNVSVTYKAIDIELINFLRSNYNKVDEFYLSWVNKNEKCRGIKISLLKEGKVTVYLYKNKIINKLSSKNYIFRSIVIFLRKNRVIQLGYLLPNKYLNMILNDDWKINIK